MRKLKLLFFWMSLSIVLMTSCQKITNKTSGKKSPQYVSKKGRYNSSRDIDFQLIHTSLKISFDFEQKRVLGKASLTLKPHFYDQDTLRLDAKGFDINSIEIEEPDFGFRKDYFYDGQIIKIPLPHAFSKKDTLKVNIDYVAKPEELPKKGTASIMENKGIYFINTDKKDPNKPIQIWTQGETESASCWFPTIDSPNQKTTQEIYITVPNDYLTLSNGSLIYSLANNDGSRTDYWKQELPHTPYLFMLAVGKYHVTCDKWREKEVCYYVEPEFKDFAKKIFGNTPEMLEFFSKKLKYDFPWDKYSQITVRDFVSGAMENTSASVFMDALQMNNRELLDRNWDGIIAHELFHHWFGDLVTCESWANLPLNESFANYSEYLWFEHKYGKDEADYHLYEELVDYLNESETKQEPLIRYHYLDKEEMFDAHSYNKGGCLLHLLRKTIGDEAFFESLNLYLKNNQFRAAEIHHFRLAVEEVTGKDMNWFFNQYFLKPGHIKIVAEHKFENNTLKVNILQGQDSVYTPIYEMPLKLAIWTSEKRIEKQIWLKKDFTEFSMPLKEAPLNVVIDADQSLVGVLFHKKQTAEWMHQFKNESQWRARKLAVSELREIWSKKSTPDSTKQKIIEFLPFIAVDNHWNIRNEFVEMVEKLDSNQKSKFVNQLTVIANFDPKTLLRAKAIEVLSKSKLSNSSFFSQHLTDSSYAVSSAALKALYEMDKNAAFAQMNLFINEKSIHTLSALAHIYRSEKDSTKFEWFVQKLPQLSGRKLYRFISEFKDFLKVMPLGVQTRSLPILKTMAMQHSFVYARMMAYNTLHSMKNLKEVNDILAEIRKSESNSMLLDHYSKLK
ncbi:MAG: M1 family metallopeptidase [Cytophagales bacterium]